MNNFILFLNSFFSYLVVFFVATAVIIAAILIGINLRKSKDKKLELQAAAEDNASSEE